jgi:hypothetical protein
MIVLIAHVYFFLFFDPRAPCGQKNRVFSLSPSYFNKNNCPSKAFDYENSSDLTITY